MTNGCRKDEASKTLENSDVVNHRLECVCARARFSMCGGALAAEWKPVCVCVCVTAPVFVCACV